MTKREAGARPRRAAEGRDSKERRFATVGRIAASPDGQVMVEFDGDGPRAARILSGTDLDELARPESRGREVLLVFQDGNQELPVVVGLLDGPAGEALSLLRQRPDPKRARHAVVDGDRVKIVADKEIVLECGEGSITIRKDGKIVVKGTHLLTRSTGPHRIKGAHVEIN